MLKLLRMAGADIVFCEEDSPILLSQHDKILRDFYPTMPMIGPVQKIQDVETLVKSHGYDLILETSDLITNHTHGIKAGAENFSAAIDAAFHGKTSS